MMESKEGKDVLEEPLCWWLRFPLQPRRTLQPGSLVALILSEKAFHPFRVETAPRTIL